MSDPFEVYQEAWDNRLNVIRETRPAFIPYDAHTVGLRAVAAAAWERGFAMRGLFDINMYNTTGPDYSINPYKEVTDNG